MCLLKKEILRFPLTIKKKWCIKCFQEARSVKLSLRQPVALGILVMIFTYTLHVGPKSVLFNSPEFPLMQGQQPRPTEGADMEQMSLLWAEALCITEHTVILSLLCDNPEGMEKACWKCFPLNKHLADPTVGESAVAVTAFYFHLFLNRLFICVRTAPAPPFSVLETYSNSTGNHDCFV